MAGKRANGKWYPILKECKTCHRASKGDCSPECLAEGLKSIEEGKTEPAWTPDNKDEWCTRCGEYKPGKVEGRYSFGVYAGRLCKQCCSGFRDNCGLDGEQGDPRELDEWPDHY